MVDYGQLAAELTQDPKSYGYGTLAAQGNDQGQADLLNLVRPEITVSRTDIRRAEVIGALVVADYDALTAARRDLMSAILLLEVVDATDATLRANLGAVFGAATQTRANLAALAQRQGSRAEQLFGTGVRIAHQDVAKALGRG